MHRTEQLHGVAQDRASNCMEWHRTEQLHLRTGNITHPPFVRPHCCSAAAAATWGAIRRIVTIRAITRIVTIRAAVITRLLELPQLRQELLELRQALLCHPVRALLELRQGRQAISWHTLWE